MGNSGGAHAVYRRKNGMLGYLPNRRTLRHPEQMGRPLDAVSNLIGRPKAATLNIKENFSAAEKLTKKTQKGEKDESSCLCRERHS